MDWDEYKQKIKVALDLFKFDEKILKVLKNSIQNNQKIFVAGNGGSAAIAMHYVSDFSKGANQDWHQNFERYKAVCLSNNICYMTAISNDSHYDEVFEQQLVNLASPKDILVLISSSGNSPNIIKAAEYAKEHGLIVIGVSGFTGGKLKQLADYSAHIDYPSYEVCEDIHAIFGHFLAVYLRESKN
jgi:D-sedoheptulose 7-phosphate isomerase